MEACVILCHSQKPSSRKGKTLFIDAVHEIAKEKTQSFLLPGHQSRILNAYKAFGNETEFAAVATTEEILEQNGDLTVHHYVARKTSVSATSIQSLTDTWHQFDTCGREFWLAMDELVETLDGNLAKEATNG
jgi:type I restriction enzyme M protein